MKNMFALVLLLVTCLATCQAADETLGIYQQCKDKKAVCVGMPPDCWSGSSDCVVMGTIQPKSSDKSKMMFKLVGTSISNQPGAYIALGIAENGRLMEDTTIFVCTSTNNMNAFWSAGAAPPTPIASPEYFHPGENSVNSGKIICKFELDSKFIQNNFEFDLTNNKYAILLASGDMQSGKPGYHHDKRHRLEPLSLASPSENSANSRYPFNPYYYLYLTLTTLLVVKVWFV